MTVVRRTIVHTIGLIILACSFLICFSGEVNAAPSSDSIGENKTYKEGSHYVLVKKGNTEYAKAKITLSRDSVLDWNEIKESSTEWNISSNKEEIVPAAKKISTIYKGKANGLMDI